MGGGFHSALPCWHAAVKGFRNLCGLRRVSLQRSSTLEFRGGGDLDERRALPIFRRLEEQGLDPHGPGPLGDRAVEMFRCMLKLQLMDSILISAQRQGRISFYVTCEGEEGAVIGAAAGLSNDDEIFSQYREHGVLIWRGFQFADFLNQCFGNAAEPGKGRQMPVHYGSRKLHFQTVSSTIATQIPNAVGAAYAMKQREEERIAVTFFGDGGTSEGDFHAGMNFAATLDCPILFICRNNGWAISTHVGQQMRGDGVASRAVSYGIASAAVDGNDALAVAEAVTAARQRCLTTKTPAFLELVTYRRGPHSTSDDSSRYRTQAQLDQEATAHPITRLRRFLIRTGQWSQKEEDSFLAVEKQNLLYALEQAELGKKAPPCDLFVDVLNRSSKILAEQEKELMQHVQKFADKY